MKKFCVFFLVLVMLLGLVSIASASVPGKILIWCDETRAPVLEEVGKEFTAKYNVPVEVQEVGFGDIRSKLTTAGPAGEGADLIIGPHDWIGELIENGLLEPISLFTELRSKFVPVSLEAFTYGGKLYGLPYATEAVALFYNKNLVPEPPATFEELITIAKGLTNREKGEYGFLIQMPDPYHTFPLLSATGGYIFGENPDGTTNPLDIGLANEGAICGANLLLRLVTEGIQMPGADYQTVTGLFNEGKLAMMISGPWVIGGIKEAGVNYGITKIPSIDGQVAKPFVGVQGFMISAFSENKILTRTFLTDFVATKETMLKLYERATRPPAFLPALEEVSANPDIKGIAISAADGIPMPKIPEMASVWGSWADAIELIVNQKLGPEQALKDAVEYIKGAIQGE